MAEQCPYLSEPDRAPWRAGLSCARSRKIRELGAGSLSSAINAASRDASLDPRGSHRFLRASLRGCRSVACGVALVCTEPLSVSAGQRLPMARTPPGHELEPITRAGFEFRRGLPHVPSVRLSLAVPWLTLEPGCLSLGKQLRVDSGLPTTPVDYGPTEPPGRRPPAPGPRRFTSPQAVAGLLRTSFSSRFLSLCRASLRYYSAAAPGGLR